MNDTYTKRQKSAKRFSLLLRTLPLLLGIAVLAGAVVFVLAGIVLSGNPFGAFEKESFKTALQWGLTAAILGLMVGILVRCCQLVSDRIRFSEDVSLLFDDEVPVLAVFPGVKKGTAEEETTPTAASLEASRLLDVNLSYAAREVPADCGKRIGFGYPAQTKDPSLLLLRIAEAFASDGKKVAVVDGDLHTSPVGARFGFSDNGGVCEYLRGKDTKINIHKHLLPGVGVILAGSPVENPAPLYQSEKFPALLAALAARYDWVLVHLPPVGEVPDAPAIAELLDATILLCEEGTTRTPHLFEAARRLWNVDGKLAGIVLGQRRPQKNDEFRPGYFEEDEPVPEGGEEI